MNNKGKNRKQDNEGTEKNIFKRMAEGYRALKYYHHYKKKQLIKIC